MHNLRRKMKWTLFSVLSILIWLIAGVFDFQNYLSVQSSLVESMSSIAEMTRGYWSPGWQGPYPDEEDLEESKPIELMYESPVFLVLYNSLKEPIQVFASAKADNVQEAVDQADKVVNRNSPGSVDASLLFSQDYAWYYPNSKMVLIVETQSLRFELLQTILISLFIALMFEGILYLICRKAADWMVKPIEETFDKQKQFIADASHELKTPVAVILANAEAMENDPDPKWLQNIVEEANRMSGLITDLLDLTRNEQKEITMAPVDLSRLVAKQCLTQEARMFEHHITLEENIQENLMVNGNASMLEQVIAILLDNATAHSTGEINVDLFSKGKDIVLDVSNTGAEIPEEIREKIFERFFRADESRNRKAGRYGLGLAIAKSIVDRHSGKIEVFCKDGRTTFQIVLRSI